MSHHSYDAFRDVSFQTFYQAYYQELLSEALTMRWKRIDAAISIIVAIAAPTSSGGAIVVWKIWETVIGQIFWGLIAAFASIAAIIHSILDVSSIIKKQEDLHSIFSRLRVELETFRQKLITGINFSDADNQYDELRKRFGQCKERTSTDIALTSGLRNRVQNQLDDILRRGGYIE